MTELSTIYNSIIIQCEQCSFTHRNQKVMNVHAMVHSTDPIRYGCPYCSFDTIWRDCMRSHIITKHSRIRRNFKTPHKIESHIEEQHKDLIKLCKFCKYSTIDKMKLIEHVNIKHTEEDCYKCWDCSYETGNLKGFNFHFQNKHNRKVY